MLVSGHRNFTPSSVAMRLSGSREASPPCRASTAMPRFIVPLFVVLLAGACATVPEKPPPATAVATHGRAASAAGQSLRLSAARTGKVSPTVAPARPAPSARTPGAFARTATTHRLAGRARAVPEEEIAAYAPRVVPRSQHVDLRGVGHARAELGRRARAEAVPAARLDGRRGIVPVPRRCVHARFPRARTRPARIRAKRMATARLLVRRLRRRSRRAARALRAGRARADSADTVLARTS